MIRRSDEITPINIIAFWALLLKYHAFRLTSVMYTIRPFCLNWNETEKIAAARNSNSGLSKRLLSLHRPSHMESCISWTAYCSDVLVDVLNSASDQTDNLMCLVTKLEVKIEIGLPSWSRQKHLVVNLVLKIVV